LGNRGNKVGHIYGNVSNIPRKRRKESTFFIKNKEKKTRKQAAGVSMVMTSLSVAKRSTSWQADKKAGR
jgi:hypothetical protein